MSLLTTWARRYPLGLILGIGVLLSGFGMGALFEQYQRPRLEEAFQRDLLDRQAQVLDLAENLLYSHVRLLQRLLEVSAQRPAVAQALSGISSHKRRFPAWMPPLLYWRGLAYPDCFILVDGNGKVEANALIDPSERCPVERFVRRTESDSWQRKRVRMLVMDDAQAWLLLEVPIGKDNVGKLGMAIHLDPTFLQTLFGGVLPPGTALVLVDSNHEGARVLAASQPDITPGIQLARPFPMYLRSEVDYLDEGEWDSIIGVSLWLKRDLLARLEQKVLGLAAQQRLAMALGYMVLLLLLAWWLGRRVVRMHDTIQKFSSVFLDAGPVEKSRSTDPIEQTRADLERVFQGMLTTLEAKELAQRVELSRRQDELMECIAEQLGIGLLSISSDEGVPTPVNTTMRRYLDELPVDAGNSLARAQRSPVIIRDLQGGRRVFEVVPLSGVQFDDYEVLLVRDITLMYQQQDQLERLATQDTLTGLPNRKLLTDRVNMLIGGARRNEDRFSLLLFDLNDFKSINDHFGHRVGDQALVEVARNVSGLLRQQDTLARLGGDEFVAVLPGTDKQGAAQLAKKLLDYQRRNYFMINDSPYALEFSIGGCEWPADGGGLDELLAHADIAMYHAKRNRLGYVAFDSSLRAGDAQRLKFLACLREAIGRGEIDVAYQPQLDAVTGEVHGWEALARWHHPELGDIPPSEFIPLAEQGGLIAELTQLVLQRALRDCVAWRQAGVAGGVSINLSALDFRGGGLQDSIDAAVGLSGLDPALVTLEITETILMEEPMLAARALQRLDDAGYWTAIDDFGTGYSSLAYLQRLPVHELKIDRAFIAAAEKDVSSRHIVESLLALASSLNLNVIAEGVEHEETAEWLINLGCDQLQGYWVGRPMSREQVLAFQTPTQWKRVGMRNG